MTELLEALKAWLVPPPMPPMPGLPFGIGGRGIDAAFLAAWKGCYFAGVKDGLAAGFALGALAAAVFLRLAQPRETPP